MQKTISNFINTEYKSYSKYVLYNRAIPNIIDGFKPVHRKIFYTALKHCKNNSIKTASLTGFVLAISNYHHGDASVEGAVNILTQEFVGANNISMFKGEGSFGNRMIPIAAAGRYTKVRLNSEFLKYFNDFEILDKNEDPENPEPLCYLPTIPWVLVNGAEGIAVGFATSILPRNPEKIKQYIKSKLEGKNSYYHFEPFFKGFKGKIYKQENSNSWVMEGCFEKIKNGLVKITELPIGFTREKYITYLDKQVERKAVKDYEENCKSGFEFTVKLEKDLTDEQIIQILRLRTTLTENIVVIDNEGKLREFESPIALVDYFLAYRLKKYNQRIERNAQLTIAALDLIAEKKRFIKMVINKELDLRKFTKSELIQYLLNNKFAYAENLVEMKIYHFTKDEIEKLNEDEKQKKNYMVELYNTTAEKEWLEELK